ncbi:taste receptor type 2 member 123-like [Hyperolius riggenbachi]|uniref:taste receptor type 2 member 123-like n=1 Tax=Hyperolius riggenbachi TaxID=752182 RepID=UPI0035A358D1
MAQKPLLVTYISDLVTVLLSAPGNVFILLVILMDVVNARSLPINGQLIFGISLLNVLHQLGFICGDIILLMEKGIIFNTVLDGLRPLSVASMSCTIWLSTLLSMYFCLKIVNMKQKFYTLLQQTFPKLLHKVLVMNVIGSLVLGYFSFSWVSKHGYSNNTFDDTGELAFTKHDPRLYSKALMFFLMIVSFIVFCLSTGIISYSLCRHIGNIQANPGSSRAISTQAHTHTIVTIFSLLISSIIRIITEVIWTIPSSSSAPEYISAVLSALNHVSTPLILIRGNRKLEKALQRFLNWLPFPKCLIFREAKL